MAEVNPKPLADVFFGVQDSDSLGQDVELAEVLSAWFRASRAGSRRRQFRHAACERD
jgi:hypothetical protein